MDFFCLAVIDGTSFWQTLRMRRFWLVLLTQVMSSSKLQRVQIYTSVWWNRLMDSSYLQNLPFHLHYHQLLWRWCQSLFDSCAHPSVWSWQTSAPLLWSLRLHPCRTDRQEKISNMVCKTDRLRRRRRRWRRRFDSHFFKGISELLHANHPSCFFQQLWGHEVYKILKVNSATNWSEKSENTAN